MDEGTDQPREPLPELRADRLGRRGNREAVQVGGGEEEAKAETEVCSTEIGGISLPRRRTAPFFARKCRIVVESGEIFTKWRLLFTQKHAIISANAEITERFAEMCRIFQNSAEQPWFAERRRTHFPEAQK